MSKKRKKPGKPTKAKAAKPKVPAIDLSTGSLLSETISLTKEVGLRGVMIALVFASPIILGHLLHDETVASLWFGVFIQVAGIGALTDLALHGPERSVYQSMRAGLLRWFDLFLTAIALQLVVSVSALFFVVPGVMYYMSFLLAFPFLMDREARGVDALGKSSRLMKGHRMKLLLAVLLSLLPGLLVLGMVYLATQDFPSDPGQRPFLPHVSSHQAVRFWNAAGETLYPLAFIPSVLLPVVVYRRLRKQTH